MPAARSPTGGTAAFALTVFLASSAACQVAPSGLAAAAIANQDFNWIEREAPGFRVYFLADSYPARHQDSLLARLPRAQSDARRLLAAEPVEGPIDLFYIESRPQMEALVGGRATGFAEPSARAVFLMTNPEWRAFEKHEVMHVVSFQSWGSTPAGNDWLVEGLAQFADGSCGGFSNTDIAIALTARHGWIPLEDVLTRFREQPDLRAYLQAAALVAHLHGRYGPAELRRLWAEGATPETLIQGESLRTIEARWRENLRPVGSPSATQFAHIEQNGCG